MANCFVKHALEHKASLITLTVIDHVNISCSVTVTSTSLEYVGAQFMYVARESIDSFLTPPPPYSTIHTDVILGTILNRFYFI